MIEHRQAAPVPMMPDQADRLPLKVTVYTVIAFHYFAILELTLSLIASIKDFQVWRDHPEASYALAV